MMPARLARLKWPMLVLATMLVLLLVVCPVAVWGLLHSEAVTQAVVPHIPGVRVWGPKGALLGDFSARRVEIDLPRGSVLSLDDAAWQHLTIHLDPFAEWHFGLHAKQLSARLVQIKWVPNPHPSPTTDPHDLRLPLSVTVDRVLAVRGDSVLWGEYPLLNLDGRLELGQHAHRVDIAKVMYGPWTLQGKGQVQTRGHLKGELNLAASGAYVTNEANLPIAAQVQASGPLTELKVLSQIKVGTAEQTQSLDVAGAVKLWAPWPLPSLHVKAQKFDLAAILARLPTTALSGSVDWGGQGPDMQAKVDMRNDIAGDGLAGLLPVRHLQGQANLPGAAKAASLHDLLQAGHVHLQAWVPAASASAQTGQAKEAGQLQLDGSWDRRQHKAVPAAAPVNAPPASPQASLPNRLKLTLQDVNLKAIDGRAPALTLSGDTTAEPNRAWQQTGDWAHAAWTIVSDLSGIYQPPSPSKGQAKGKANKASKAAQATLRGQWQTGKVQIDELTLDAEGAQASLKGQATYREPTQAGQAWAWQTQGKLQVQGFDPKVWLPWPDVLTGTNRLQGQLDFDLASTWLGQAALRLDPSELAGAAVQGQASWKALPNRVPAQAASQAQTPTQSPNQPQLAYLDVDLTAAGNHIKGQGQLPWHAGPDGLPRVKGEQRWELDVQAPALRALQALASAWGVNALTGQVNAQAKFTGQWPRFTTEGQLQAQQVHWQLTGQTASDLDSAKATWSLQTLAWDAPMQCQANVSGLKLPHLALDQANWTLSGTGRDHQSALRAQGKLITAEANKQGGKQPEPMLVVAALHGGLQVRSAGGKEDVTGWQGRIQSLNWQSAAPDEKPSEKQGFKHVWLQAQPFDLAWHREGEVDHVSVTPVSLTVMGAAMSLKEFDWQTGGSDANAGVGQVKALLQLEPLNLPALLKQWQPQAGWGGDMIVGGHVQVLHSATQPWQVNAQVAKVSGDLSLSEPSIEGSFSQRLGVDVAALGLTAKDGVWALTEQFEGSTLGRLVGKQTVKVANPQVLPSASDVLSGELDIQIGNLRPWATWMPAGWRLSGQLNGKAELMGTLGAPQYKGTLVGKNLHLAQALLGVSLTDGQLMLDMQGDHAHLTELTAKGGPQGGTIRATGEATFGESPQAKLDVTAEHFALLQRIDRRLAISGQANAFLSETDIQLNGKVLVDEGLFDFSRSDAPTVGEDVNVLNGPGQTKHEEDETASGAGTKRKMTASVDIDLGSRLHLRGRGLDTDLTGNLKFTTPNNRPSLQGTVRAVHGTYAAYGQKLEIERGAIIFIGPFENPRLDILAMRHQSPMAASSDVKVGVQIAGTALDPRISLYSDPSMSETDKLSWLILGRGPSGLGGADIGLLQSAAVALLSGEGPSTTDNIMSTLGLDELSLRQSDGTVRETVVNVGKQLSKYWYLGYERNLNATSGNWQLIYRLAQRFTLRAQTGNDNAVDLIWAWRWD